MITIEKKETELAVPDLASVSFSYPVAMPETAPVEPDTKPDTEPAPTTPDQDPTPEEPPYEPAEPGPGRTSPSREPGILPVCHTSGIE